MRIFTDTQTGILFGIPKSAICVQKFDDSLNLQFTLLIAIRCVLHRCENQEIHCQKLFFKLTFFRQITHVILKKKFIDT